MKTKIFSTTKSDVAKAAKLKEIEVLLKKIRNTLKIETKKLFFLTKMDVARGLVMGEVKNAGFVFFQLL